MRVVLKIAVSELASWDGDVYIRPLVAQAPDGRAGYPAIWLITSRCVDCLPRYRPNGETGRRMGLKIPRS